MHPSGIESFSRSNLYTLRWDHDNAIRLVPISLIWYHYQQQHQQKRECCKQ